VLTLSLSRHSGDFIPRIDLTPLEIVFNKHIHQFFFMFLTAPLGKFSFFFFRKSKGTSSSAELSLLSPDVERNFNSEFKPIFCQ
jgi:hypothetical protein